MVDDTQVNTLMIKNMEKEGFTGLTLNTTRAIGKKEDSTVKVYSTRVQTGLDERAYGVTETEFGGLKKDSRLFSLRREPRFEFPLLP